ncbi:MAG: hypothetical protein V3576_07965 [Candidatus Cloacimonadota bacterium]
MRLRWYHWLIILIVVSWLLPDSSLVGGIAALVILWFAFRLILGRLGIWGRYCPHCGAKTWGGRYCRNCGKRT